MKIENEWFFNDGFNMLIDFSVICFLKLSDINEIYFWVYGFNFFFGWDMFLICGYSFICEFYWFFFIY